MADLPEHVATVLDQWAPLAFFAYDGFERHGRGLVLIEPSIDGGHGASAEFVVFAPDAPLDPPVAALLAAYDPETELLVQFLDAAQQIRTLRVATAPGHDHPKRVWFFEMLERLAADPEQVEQPLPEWFLQALADLEAAREPE